MVMQLMTAVIMAAQAAGVGQPPQSPPTQVIPQRIQPTVSLTAPLVGADGSRRGPGVAVTDAGARLYVSSRHGSCEASISPTEPTDARDGWRISARIVSRDSVRSTTDAVEWQRLWSGGRAITNGASARTEVELRSGDNVPLDRLDITAPGLPCHGQLRTLEIQVLGNVVVRAPDRPIMRPPAPVIMDVWLVHRSPAGVENTYAVSLPFDPAETRFAFRTPPVTSDEGTFSVDVDGTVVTVQRDDGSLGLWAGIRRMIQSTSDAEVRLTTGSGGSVVDWGQPGEVISFDLPDPQPIPAGAGVIGGGGRGGSGRGGAVGGISNTASPSALHVPPLMGHKFSVRIRFTPAR